MRNFWAHAVIFCGHFPEGVAVFPEDQLDGETRGQWYVRQMLGSANLSGGPLLHVMTGNLSHQIEHHIFPDIPSNRYPRSRPRVREICERYGLRYTTGPLRKQYATVLRKINRYALPRRAETAAPRRATPRRSRPCRSRPRRPAAGPPRGLTASAAGCRVTPPSGRDLRPSPAIRVSGGLAVSGGAGWVIRSAIASSSRAAGSSSASPNTSRSPASR